MYRKLFRRLITSVAMPVLRLPGMPTRTLCLVLTSSMAFVTVSCYAGSYDDFFKALQLDLAPSVKSLLDRGVDANSVDPIRGDPALIYAVRLESKKVLQVLLAAPDINIEARAVNGDTALMVAAYKGEKDVVVALLDKGAEPNRPGWTALHYAASSGNVAIVRLLLEKSAYIDAAAPNQTTPLMMAAASGQTAVIECLLEEGADPSLKNDLGMTARDFVLKFSDVQRVPSPYP